VVLPALAIGLTRALGMRGPVAAALVLVACAPSGRYAPQFVKLGGVENPSFAAELTLFAVKLTGFTAPITVGWAFGHEHVHIRDIGFLAQLVAFQLVPMWCGKWLAHHRRRTAEQLVKPANVVAAGLAVALIVAAAIVGGRDAGAFTHDAAWLAVLVVGAASPLLGWLMGAGNRDAQRTLAITSNARELALSLAIANAITTDARVRPALFAVWLFFSAASLAVAMGLRGHWPRRVEHGA
jgi:predicted Na+-dependent transporter